ncbi:MAG TPA: glycerate kinase, partial [Aggregatilineales bacterium]|nr:glycerate kinase [Aggregatilineales bacterium]
GLEILPPARRDPAQTTTYGTGELIRAALERGCRSLLIGIGGSATNDGGAGALMALGARLLDAEGNSIALGGGGLGRLARIEADDLRARLAGMSITILCDVDNPLIGERGASFTFAPQKGASPTLCAEL